MSMNWKCFVMFRAWICFPTFSRPETVVALLPGLCSLLVHVYLLLAFNQVYREASAESGQILAGSKSGNKQNTGLRCKQSHKPIRRSGNEALQACNLSNLADFRQGAGVADRGAAQVRERGEGRARAGAGRQLGQCCWFSPLCCSELVLATHLHPVL